MGLPNEPVDGDGLLCDGVGLGLGQGDVGVGSGLGWISLVKTETGIILFSPPSLAHKLYSNYRRSSKYWASTYVLANL